MRSHLKDWAAKQPVDGGNQIPTLKRCFARVIQVFLPNSEKEERLFDKGVRPKFKLKRSVHLVVQKYIKALSVHLFVNMK